MTRTAEVAGTGARRQADPTESPGRAVVVGKDVLELLSSAMYVDPLTIYREYVQNAADAVDDARARGWLAPEEPGVIVLDIDETARSVRIRDNGMGVPVRQAAARLLAIGGSSKRGSSARGFRGVGRLAGLAYCRRLSFRTRTLGDDQVFELSWDCMRLRAALREVGVDDDLPHVLDRIVQMRRIPPGPDTPEHFFEVELGDVVRHHKRDALLNEDMIADYLSEVAPIPFGEDFGLDGIISEHLRPAKPQGVLNIVVNGRLPLRRPHTDVALPLFDGVEPADRLELLHFEGRSGETSAVGWLLHHDYGGALPDTSRIRGLRLRCGDVQVGEPRILDSVFPEARFNAWTVGEVHVVDRRIVPNARRDDFEQNAHYADLIAQLEPVGRAIGRRCRSASVQRNRVRATAAGMGALAARVAAEPHRVTPGVASAARACAAGVAAFARQLPAGSHTEQLRLAAEALQEQLNLSEQSDDITTLVSSVEDALRRGAMDRARVEALVAKAR